MEKKIPLWQMAGFVFTGAFGTLLHFLFDWTGGSIPVALFSAVNESIWEHMKLLFYPMVFFALVEYFTWGKERKNFWCIKLIGILLSLVIIPVVYYTYTGILGVNADWFNITIFFIAAALGYLAETKLFQKDVACCLPSWVAIGILCMIAAAFTVFTFLPPEIPFFQDPQNGTYGYLSAWKGGLL
jgi:hypothetical protein